MKAVGLSRYDQNALEEASDLGSKGLLFVKPPGPDGARSKLIVVAETDDLQLRQRVDRLLCDHAERLFEANELLSFAAEIKREAH